MNRIVIIAVCLVVALLSVAYATEVKDDQLSGYIELPRTGQASCFDEYGNLVDFVSSGQDGEHQRGMQWPEPRFVVNDDGTVTDLLTGLMWLKDPSCLGKLPWSVSIGKIDALNWNKVSGCKDYTAEYEDWFIPNVNQLASLIKAEEQVFSDYLKISGIAVSPESYWSSTSYQNLLTAWTVNFNTGDIIFQNKMKSLPFLAARVYDSSKNKTLRTGQTKSLMPGDDGALQLGVTSGKDRFIDNGDGTTTDSLTGLMWLQDVHCFAELDWQAALVAVAEFNKGDDRKCKDYNADYQDWFLPNQLELRSLVDYSKDYPSLPSPDILNSKSNQLWSSTTYTGQPDKAFNLNLGTGLLLASTKSSKIHILPARFAVQRPQHKRIKSVRDAHVNVAADYVLKVDPQLRKEINWPPEPRFVSNGDGTSLDTVTGLYWLTDANCFGKISWRDAKLTILSLNRDPQQYSCQGEMIDFNDWQMPTRSELQELINPHVEDSTVWLMEQGIKNVQAGGDYWTETETSLNLYFAHVVNLKHGGMRNYPKSLRFYLWPHRASVGDPGQQPVLTMSINGMNGTIKLSPADPLSVRVNLHSLALRSPADFWFWYETPKSDQLWMTPIHTWQDEMGAVYQGDLFTLMNYEIFKSGQNNLAPGEYTFHFAVDFNQDGSLDENRHEISLAVRVE